MELRSRGWSIGAAAREVGVSRTTGNNWSRGYKVYRRGEVIKVVSPLDRLEVREISARYLSQEERVLIADLVHARHGIRSIARQLGRSPSTISRELHRNGEKGGSYRPFEAHRAATGRRARAPKRRLETNPLLAKKVGELLSQRWSPQQISRHLRTRYPDQPGMWLCHETIYQAIYRPGSVFMRPTPLAPHRRSPLRTGREHRRAHHRSHARRARFQQPMLSVHERPAAVADRGQSGHWEGDLIVGKDQGSAIGTLVERTSRMTRLLHLPLRDSDALHDALIARMSDLPAWLLRSITWDQGSEMAQHLASIHRRPGWGELISLWAAAPA
jgi:IS30 family transposase